MHSTMAQHRAVMTGLTSWGTSCHIASMLQVSSCITHARPMPATGLGASLFQCTKWQSLTCMQTISRRDDQLCPALLCAPSWPQASCYCTIREYQCLVDSPFVRLADADFILDISSADVQREDRSVDRGPANDHTFTAVRMIPFHPRPAPQ